MPATRGTEVGLTNAGKGSKLMLVTDGWGTPLDFLVQSANEAQIALAADKLATNQVPQLRGRPWMRLSELVADKAYDPDLFPTKLRWRGIHPSPSASTARRMGDTSKALHTRGPQPLSATDGEKPARPTREDCEYVPNENARLVLWFEPPAVWRRTKAREQGTREDKAEWIREMADARHPTGETIVPS